VHPRRAGWAFPWIVLVAGWVVLAIGYGFAGLDKLLTSTAWREGTTLQQTLAWATVSLEVLFPVLLVTRRTRLVAWTAMLVVQIGTLAFGASADLTFGAVMLQLFVFDPEWLPARQPAAGRSVAFYDGVCVLCHASVRLLLEEDRRRVVAFAQLQGETFETVREAVQVPDDLDSLLYVQGVGTDTVVPSVRSQAVLEILRDIGGFWRVVSWLRIVPRPLRDGVYRIIAKNRYKWFGRRGGAASALISRRRR
jgi:predicted DCC family thiol-disulfide oxidoreductase YuxK